MTRNNTDPCPTPAARAAAHFSARAAAVFLVGLTFVGIVVSGTAVMIAPSGRVANTLEWLLMGLSRFQWERLHLTMGAAFLGAGLWHIWLHWSVIRNLLWSAAARTICHRRELALAVGITVFVVGTAVFNLPPASWLEQLEIWFRRSFW